LHFSTPHPHLILPPSFTITTIIVIINFTWRSQERGGDNVFRPARKEGRKRKRKEARKGKRKEGKGRARNRERG